MSRTWPFQTQQVSYLCPGNLECRVQVWLLEEKPRGLVHLGGPDAGVQGSFGDGDIWGVGSFPLWNAFSSRREKDREQLLLMAWQTRGPGNCVHLLSCMGWKQRTREDERMQRLMDEGDARSRRWKAFMVYMCRHTKGLMRRQPS